ncbi:MAG: S-methyl-5'-thioadenosine phosphorylase [Alphaproteobacteria bacterium]|nr:MAG: S-methyl-5'-thioadenosine phosphorylase [Alphaproteobacteria bacterium]
MGNTVLGIIGGSGLSDLPGLQDKQWRTVDSAFGAPSDQLCFGHINGQKIVFLPRHGRGHTIPPDAINFRANIDAMKRAEVTDLVSFSAVGSLREDLPPGSFVRVDQYIDRTLGRVSSFFGTGLVAHVSMGDPTCSRLGQWADAAAAQVDVPLHAGGTYLAMNGPQFSTQAESHLYRSWGCDVIGMTNMPEAKLAREAEICYITIAMVTDFDCWHPDHDHVEVAQIIGVMNANADKAKTLMAGIAAHLGQVQSGDRTDCDTGCDHALENAIITGPDARNPKLVGKLSAILQRVNGGSDA